MPSCSNTMAVGERTVKSELRENLICKLQRGEELFPGIVGYEDTVVPQIVNAVLSRHNFILLGLRGQAKTRIIRMLTGLLDEHLPYIAGCEIRDNPLRPICRRCRDLIAELGDKTPVVWLDRDRALRGKAGDARRDHRRHDRRHRSDQGRARRA
jgi:magnesium chelatase subunit I